MKEMSRECKEYFDTLPQSVKETISQSDADFENLEELKGLANSFLKNTKE